MAILFELTNFCVNQQKERDLRVTYIPDKRPNGNIEGFIMTSEDISEYKITERLVTAYNHDLLQQKATLDREKLKSDRQKNKIHLFFKNVS